MGWLRRLGAAVDRGGPWVMEAVDLGLVVVGCLVGWLEKADGRGDSGGMMGWEVTGRISCIIINYK